MRKGSLGVDPISPAVRALIAEHIRSVVELECLLLLQRDATRHWGSDELGRELRIAPEWALGELMDLTQRGFAATDGISRPPRYYYAPATPALEELVTQLATNYAERRVSVIEMIYAKPAADPLKSFSEAFRIRKEPPGG